MVAGTFCGGFRAWVKGLHSLEEYLQAWGLGLKAVGCRIITLSKLRFRALQGKQDQELKFGSRAGSDPVLTSSVPALMRTHGMAIFWGLRVVTRTGTYSSDLRGLFLKPGLLEARM